MNFLKEIKNCKKAFTRNAALAKRSHLKNEEPIDC